MTDILYDAKKIITAALKDAMPGAAVVDALHNISFGKGRLVVVAAGKAAWEMAKAANDSLGRRIDSGIVITKYGHSHGAIANLRICEAGHPVPDENSYKATEQALELVKNLGENDEVLFLLSGGGSALFEKPAIPGEETEEITKQLLASGADIVEMNTIRKRLSLVKGGRFALACRPAQVYTVVLSDIIGDPLDMIASGPAYPDASTCEQALMIKEKYGLKMSAQAEELLKTETPKKLDNVTTFVTGSVKQLCSTAERVCKRLGYETAFLTASLSCEARDAGAFLGSIAADNQNRKSIAYIAGGETVVHLKGKGKGGRNQEIALSAARYIENCKNTCIFSVGSDGTDGPTDAAGGIVTEKTAAVLKEKNINIPEVLENNDAYNALKAADGLIITGPTGTNVNDLSVVLIKRP
ncbi:MAG: glycerate kinase [Lachnospiraceae bacterium]|nr:glycerate kinase [Candidatus Darwinimomas equi]